MRPATLHFGPRLPNLERAAASTILGLASLAAQGKNALLPQDGQAQDAVPHVPIFSELQLVAPQGSGPQECHTYSVFLSTGAGHNNVNCAPDGTFKYHYKNSSCECEVYCDTEPSCKGFVDMHLGDTHLEERHCRFKTVTEPTGTGESKESDEKNFYVKPPEASTPIAIHGDPMFKYNGTGTHFWIPAGKLSPLLTWKSATGHTLELRGRTFERKETGNQWFKQLVVVQVNGEKDDTIVDVTSNNDGCSVKRPASVATPEGVNVTVTEVPPMVQVEANGVAVELKAARSLHFKEKEDAAHWAHLNMELPEGIPVGAQASGIFAELAGAAPMSAETKEMLAKPKP